MRNEASDGLSRGAAVAAAVIDAEGRVMLSNDVSASTRRKPMIVPVVIEL